MIKHNLMIVFAVTELGLLLFALFSAGKYVPCCHFPEFCQKVSIKLPGEGGGCVPVSVAKEVACPGGGGIKWSIRFSWNANRQLVADFTVLLVSEGKVIGKKLSQTALTLPPVEGKPLLAADLSFYPELSHISYLLGCGEHEALLYVIKDSMLTTADTLALKVGLGYPNELFSSARSEYAPSPFANIVNHLRNAWSSPSALRLRPEVSRLMDHP